MTLAYMIGLPGAFVRHTTDVDTTGVVRARVMVKPTADDPEVPYPNAKVGLLRLATLRLEWRGLSDQSGEYAAIGLVRGESYVPVAVDPASIYECVAAGPVIAGPDTDA